MALYLLTLQRSGPQSGRRHLLGWAGRGPSSSSGSGVRRSAGRGRASEIVLLERDLGVLIQGVRSERTAGPGPGDRPPWGASLPTCGGGLRSATMGVVWKARRCDMAMKRNTKIQIAGLAGGATAVGAAIYAYKHRETPRKGVSPRK